MDPNFFAPYRLHEITYNIFPNCEPYSGSGKLEIVAGRVLDSAEKPLEARVTARWSGGSRSTVSDARGMYALWVPSNTTVTLRAECGGLGFNELSVDVRASVHESGNKDGTCLVGNVCSADFTARPRKVVYLPGWEDTVEKIFTDRGISVERVGLTALRDSYVLDPAEVDVFIASIPIMSTHYFSIYKKVRDYVEAGGMLIATGPGHAFVTHLGGGFRMQPSHLQGMDLSLPSRLPQHGGVGLREHVEREGAVDNFLFAAKNWPFIESVSDGKSLVIGNMVYENVNTGLPAALNNWPQGMYFKRGKGRAIYTTFPLYRNYTQGSSAVRRAAEYIALLPFNEAGLRRLESSFGLDDGRERSFAFNSPARAGRSGGMRIESVQPGSGLSFLVSLMGGLSGGRGSLRRGGERFSATLIRPDGSEFASQSSGGSRLVFEVPASENTAVASWSVRLDSPGRFTKTGTVAAVCFSGSADIPLDEPAPVIPPAVEDLSDGGGGGSPSGPDRPDDDPPEKSPDVPLPVDPVVPVDPVDPVDPPDPEDPEWGGSGGCGMGGGVVLLWALFPGCLLYAAGKKRL